MQTRSSNPAQGLAWQIPEQHWSFRLHRLKSGRQAQRRWPSRWREVKPVQHVLQLGCRFRPHRVPMGLQAAAPISWA